VGAAALPALGQGLFVHAMSGQPVAGGMPGEVFTGFDTQSPPVINNGNIAFRASTNASPNPRDSPLIVGHIGSAMVAFRFAGDTGTPGLSFAPTEWDVTRYTTRIAANGTFGVMARVQGLGVTGSTDEVLVVGSTQGVHIIAREGAQAPGDTPGAVMRGGGGSNTWFESLRGWSLSDTGLVALTTPVTRPGLPQYASHTGVFSDVNGELDLVARGNHAIFGAGTIVEGWSTHMLDGSASISPRGITAVAAVFDSPHHQSGGIIVHRGGELRRFVSIQEVPGTPEIRLNRPHTNDFSTIGLNDSGMVSTSVNLLNSANQRIGTAVVRASADALNIVAKTGDPKPGFPGQFFSTTELQYARTTLSASGLVAFPDQSRRGVFVGTSIDDLSLMFGPDIPIWPTGLGTPLIYPYSLGVNTSNQIVAAFSFEGSTTRGIAGWDPEHGYVLLAYTGQTVEIAPGVFRTILQLGLSGLFSDPWSPVGSPSGGGEDGLPNSLDDAGRVVFAARFTNGESAVLVATIPAPAGVGVLALGLLAMRRRRAWTLR
jgi:hypothetical protein